MAEAEKLSAPQEPFRLSCLIVGERAGIADHLGSVQRPLSAPFARNNPNAARTCSHGG
jgi:hypothetical protein